MFISPIFGLKVLLLLLNIANLLNFNNLIINQFFDHGLCKTLLLLFIRVLFLVREHAGEFDLLFYLAFEVHERFWLEFGLLHVVFKLADDDFLQREVILGKHELIPLATLGNMEEFSWFSQDSDCPLLAVDHAKRSRHVAVRHHNFRHVDHDIPIFGQLLGCTVLNQARLNIGQDNNFVVDNDIQNICTD